MLGSLLTMLALYTWWQLTFSARTIMLLYSKEFPCKLCGWVEAWSVVKKKDAQNLWRCNYMHQQKTWLYSYCIGGSLVVTFLIILCLELFALHCRHSLVFALLTGLIWGTHNDFLSLKDLMITWSFWKCPYGPIFLAVFCCFDALHTDCTNGHAISILLKRTPRVTQFRLKLTMQLGKP